MNILHILDGLYAAGIEKQAYEIINNFPSRYIKIICLIFHQKLKIYQKILKVWY